MTAKHIFFERFIIILSLSRSFSQLLMVMPPSLCLSNIVSALSRPPERETEQGARRDRMTQRKREKEREKDRERERTAKSQNLVS